MGVCSSFVVVRRLSFLRRLRAYTMGGHFIAPYKSILFLSHLGSLGALFRSSLGALRARLAVRGPLFAAQAAQIRVGVLFLCSNRQITFMRRLLTYAPSVVPGRCGGLSLMRRLRISASASYFFVFKQIDQLLCAGCVHTRHRWSPGAAAASRCCAGCAYLISSGALRHKSGEFS